MVTFTNSTERNKPREAQLIPHLEVHRMSIRNLGVFLLTFGFVMGDNFRDGFEHFHHSGR